MARSEASTFLPLPLRRPRPRPESPAHNSIRVSTATASSSSHLESSGSIKVPDTDTAVWSSEAIDCDYNHSAPGSPPTRPPAGIGESESDQIIMRVKAEKSECESKNESPRNASDRAVEEYFKNDSEQEMFPSSSDSDSNSGAGTQSSNMKKTGNGNGKAYGKKRKAALADDDEGDYHPDLGLVKTEDGDHVEHDEDEDEDIKPGISDDDSFFEFTKKKNNNKKAKRSPRSSYSPSKAKMSSASPTKDRKSKTSAAPRAWTGEEDWQLFQRLHPKIVKPDWSGIAETIGSSRDAKKRLEGAIKSISGSP
ncbi:hypothetical protein I316_04234 [Kwoniella heveanensis BCC8398]|uniref:Myb-like domain-containing protein n=1 Tax=Kwoniella heveanensis BCC8398 TaxID=1296120 RepID=A0A1B9GS43_9TREE|nr:hypothetical protein I316_04234 [Kwoniella heveanensis BCC8398]